MFNEDLINWRAHTPDADRYPSNVVALLDTAGEFAADDAGAYVYFARGNCDMFNLQVLAKFLEDTGLLTTDSEKRECKAVIEWLKKHETPFMTTAEVEMRMKLADGHCPLCSAHISFNRPEEDGKYRVLGHCWHFKYDIVSDPESTLRHAASWHGYRWPHDLFGSAPLAKPDGQPISREPLFSPHCETCRLEGGRHYIRREVKRLLTDLVQRDNPEWVGFGSSPLLCFRRGISASVGVRCSCQSAEPLCDHVQSRIDEMADAITDESNSEFRLNGAGLKIYGTGVRLLGRYDLDFSMWIDGDQRDSYSRFVAEANALIRERGLRDFKYPGKD